MSLYVQMFYTIKIDVLYKKINPSNTLQDSGLPTDGIKRLLSFYQDKLWKTFIIREQIWETLKLHCIKKAERGLHLFKP